MLRHSKHPTNRNFFIAAIPSALAVATKLSAVPIVFVYISSFFLFHKSKRNLWTLIRGVTLFLAIAILVGVPDVLLGKAKGYDNFLYSNIVNNWDSNLYNISSGHIIKFILVDHFPLLFGHALYALGCFAVVYWTGVLLVQFVSKKTIMDKYALFYLFSFFCFGASLIPLRMWATGNRALVLLPFLVLLIVLLFEKIKKSIGKRFQFVWHLILGIILILQILESFIWLQFKWQQSPQQKSSFWMQEHIKKGSVVGVENIPIYQKIPDIVLKEFYSNDKKNTLYSYTIVDNTTKQLPHFIIVSDTTVIPGYLKLSPKKELLVYLEKRRYKKIKEFTPDFSYYSLIGDDFNFVSSGLVAIPSDISIYEKTK